MNLPNKLTVLRVLMIPIFLVCLYYTEYWAVVVFVLASLTDALDGWIARKYNLITDLGKFLDPLADKILVCAALIALSELQKIPAWIVIIIISREFAITGFRILAASSGKVIAAGTLGKIKTITQMIMTVYLLFNFNFPYSHAIGYVLMGIATFFTVISGIEYIYKNKSLLAN